MKKEDLQLFIDTEDIKPIAPEYLQIYVGDADWPSHLQSFLMQFTKRYGGIERVSKDSALIWRLRNLVAYTILYPTEHGYSYINKEHPENLLFTAISHRQFQAQEAHWVPQLKRVVQHDVEIRDWRSQALNLGYIDPIDYHPFTRQAFNWLYDAAETSGAISEQNEKDIRSRFTNLVYVYGGAVICNIFSRNSDYVKKIINWRSGYFFERLIYSIYDIDQVVRIKRAELAKGSEKVVRNFAG